MRALVRRTIAFALVIGVVISAPASAELVTITLDLSVQRRVVGDFFLEDGGTYADPSFVPFSTTASLTFDAAWDHTFSGAGPYSNTHTEVFFVGHNQFASPLTSGLPWGPPATSAANLERNIAFFGHDAFDPPIGGAENGMYWDDWHYYDNGAGLEYGYHIILQQNSDGSNPIVSDPLTFRTAEMLQYLQLLQTSGIQLSFSESGLVHDYHAHRTVDFVEYQASALIRNIEIVPVPAALWLLGSALGVLGVMRRRPLPSN